MQIPLVSLSGEAEVVTTLILVCALGVWATWLDLQTFDSVFSPCACVKRWADFVCVCIYTSIPVRGASLLLFFHTETSPLYFASTIFNSCWNWLPHRMCFHTWDALKMMRENFYDLVGIIYNHSIDSPMQIALKHLPFPKLFAQQFSL